MKKTPEEHHGISIYGLLVLFSSVKEKEKNMQWLGHDQVLALVVDF
jgi:hypothetical protein